MRRGVRRLSLASKGQLRDDSLEDISDEEEEEGSQEAQFSRLGTVARRQPRGHQ